MLTLYIRVLPVKMIMSSLQVQDEITYSTPPAK